MFLTASQSDNETPCPLYNTHKHKRHDGFHNDVPLAKPTLQRAEVFCRTFVLHTATAARHFACLFGRKEGTFTLSCL